MLFTLALLSSSLLASVALAAPSPQYGARMARRREVRLSQLNERLEELSTADSASVIYSANWAGALWDRPAGTFNYVTGTFTVPLASGANGASASIWVGIDGDTCANAILQTGIDFTITNGTVMYDAWYEWYPDYAEYFTGIVILPGHQVRLSVFASSPTTGVASVDNLTTGQTVYQNLNSTSALCQQNAEWIVEDFQENGALTPFANFGAVTFNNAYASGPENYYTPSGATVIDLKQNNNVLTSVSIEGPSISVSYV